jgi:hypothetical protein
LLRLQGWPESLAAADWRQEIVSFQSDAEQRFAPSMRQLIDLTVLYASAAKQLEHAQIDGVSAGKRPVSRPVCLDELRNGTCWRNGLGRVQDRVRIDVSKAVHADRKRVHAWLI